MELSPPDGVPSEVLSRFVLLEDLGNHATCLHETHTCVKSSNLVLINRKIFSLMSSLKSRRGLLYMVSAMSICAFSAHFAYTDRAEAQEVCINLILTLLYLSECTMDSSESFNASKRIGQDPVKIHS